MRYSYPIWLIIFVMAPLVCLWAWKFKILKRYLSPVLLACLGALLFSFPWDYIAVKERIWYFEKPYIIGVWFLGLPIEEWIFIIFVTALFASVTALLWDRQRRKE